jgi:hypothetical protein
MSITAGGAPRPPDEHYLWLGRVCSNFAVLDIQMGQIGHAAVTGEAWTENWTLVAGKPGLAYRLCAKAVGLLDGDLALAVQTLLEDSSKLRDERHRLTHGAFVIDPETTMDSHPWLLRTARNEEVALLTGETGGRLVRSLVGLTRRAADLRAPVAQHARSRRLMG